MRAHIVHGFNVKDAGKGTTDTLKPFLYAAGYEVLDQDYGWFGLLSVRFRNDDVARRIAKSVLPGDIAFGHSNAGDILRQAAWLGAPFKGIVLIHPALDRDTRLAPQVEWVQVYHSSKDEVVVASKFLWFNHPWGDMGNVGYKGQDARWTNFEERFEHSEMFQHMAEWGPRLLENLPKS